MILSFVLDFIADGGIFDMEFTQVEWRNGLAGAGY